MNSRFKEECEIVDDMGVLMAGKLMANSHKPSWRSNDPAELRKTMRFLLGRLQGEVSELEGALEGFLAVERNCKASEVRLECADVCNMAAMIADCANLLAMARFIAKVGEET